MRPGYLRILGSIIALIVLYLAMSSLMSMREILDARFYYSAPEASGFFKALSPAGARLYLKHELLDLLFFSSYSVLSFSVVEVLFPKPSKMKFFAVFPGIFDLIETGSIIAILLGAPAAIFAGWLGFATCLKWITGCLLSVLIFARTISVIKTKLTAVI